MDVTRRGHHLSWLEKLGFEENPFYLQPVAPDDSAIARGFINRDTEREKISDYVHLRKYKLLILGKTGEGKSSILSIFHNYGRKLNKQIITLDALNNKTREDFIESLLRWIQANMHLLSRDQTRLLNERLEKLNITSKKGKTTVEIASQVEGKIQILIASIGAAVKGKEAEEEQIEYYVPSRLKKLEGINNEVLPKILQSGSFILLVDNLEKLDRSEFLRVIKEVILPLPDDLLLVATGNYDAMDQHALSLVKRVFDDLLPMDEVDRAKLALLIRGRMKAYTKNSKPKIAIDDEAIDTLKDFTEGNLRESFRLCFRALMDNKKDITREMIENAIVNECVPILRTLDTPSKNILKVLAKGGKLSVSQMQKSVNIDIGRDTLYDRTEQLRIQRFLKAEYRRVKRQPPTAFYFLPEYLRKLCGSVAI